jgi:hypothetical protein
MIGDSGIDGDGGGDGPGLGPAARRVLADEGGQGGQPFGRRREAQAQRSGLIRPGRPR